MNISTLSKKNIFKKAAGIAILLAILLPGKVSAQCGFAAGLGCPGTDYSNYGYNSTGNAATLEYDNFVSAFHSTVIRNSDGKFQIWGEQAAADGSSSLVVPTEINGTNFPGVTGTPIKMAMGSLAVNHQKILLTTDGLFVWGNPGSVISTGITNTSSVKKISVNGKSDGLPPGVSPSQVKMLFASTRVLAITTCDGTVFVLSNSREQNQGDGLALHSTTWSQVKVDAPGNPYLSDAIAVRGSTNTMMALTRNNEVYTWGYRTISGIESSYNPIARKYATKMKLPEDAPIKMIGVTSYDKAHDRGSTYKDEPTYYILYTSGRIYGMGSNELNQLGDFTTLSSPSSKSRNWVQPHYPEVSDPNTAGVVMDDVRWISPNEHDLRWPAINILNNDARVWNWGSNAGSMIGRTDFGQDKNTRTSFNPGQPLANDAFDPAASKVMTIETGGHTTMIIQECQENFGYVGHAIHGSTAAGQDGDTYYPKFIFNTATVQVCGTQANPEISFATNPVTGSNDNILCMNQVLELVGTPAGGVFTVESGAGMLTNGNLLTFTGGYVSGTVKIRYTVATSTCSHAWVERDIPFEACMIYKIKGTVWMDNNSDAIKDVGELGTNGAISGNNGLWANLVDANNKVLSSVKVAVDGSYELPVLQNGTYSVHITNEKIGIGATIAPASDALPAGWKYTGNNRSNTSVCVIPSCVNPNLISGVVINNNDVEGLNFGILGLYTVSGTVFHDANGLNGSPAAVDGIPVFTAGSGYETPAQPPLYIAIVGKDGKVFQYAPVNNDGTYSVIIPANDVVFQLTSSQPVKGNPPVQTLPANWYFVGESFGVGNGSGTGVNDGTGTGYNAPSTKQDGKINVSFAGGNTSITNVDFGIETPPVADAKSYLNISPGVFKLPSETPVPGFPVIDSYKFTELTNSELGPLTGSDPEDCPIAQSCSTGATFRVHSLESNTRLYYDFGGTIGVKEIDPVNGISEIPQFDPAKMVIYGKVDEGYDGLEFVFTYSMIDAAGLESPPVPYIISMGRALSVSLTNFEASIRITDVELKWITASEHNNRSFEVEKSTDIKKWNTIATVFSKAEDGNSNSKLRYSFTDQNVPPGVYYYRLKQIDLDGTPHFSEIRSVSFKGSPGITVYPNPVISTVTISGLTGPATLVLYDFRGKQLKSGSTNDKNFVWDISDFPVGVYNLVISGPGNSVSTFKLYKN